MITVDKWFRINRADTGLCNYWPELSAGTVFKVRELAKECEDDIEPDTGIIEIELSDGKLLTSMISQLRIGVCGILNPLKMVKSRKL